MSGCSHLSRGRASSAPSKVRLQLRLPGKLPSDRTQAGDCITHKFAWTTVSGDSWFLDWTVKSSPSERSSEASADPQALEPSASGFDPLSFQTSPPLHLIRLLYPWEKPNLAPTPNNRTNHCLNYWGYFVCDSSSQGSRILVDGHLLLPSFAHQSAHLADLHLGCLPRTNLHCRSLKLSHLLSCHGRLEYRSGTFMIFSTNTGFSLLLRNTLRRP